ncbi:NUDIX hydrolase [Alkalicoccobacillus porphyridii]|uniref:NUDIX domain-containing protein n=1 Tax=Alkalicoccobacillus porphyridii TaxID=2597270 RepID=A0A553ZVR2_9BACI|nr:NUDIX domain-containing protein [Alkalicoccobacillus porphyridii]TSB45568.1 NUDIX domain-containing protein [Alkalicoccobacillus porphyridii]
MDKETFEIPLKCRGIAVVLLKKCNNENKVLLLKRDSTVLQNVWCYIGGGMEGNEYAWQAALREIEEETGITNVTLYSANKIEQFYSPHTNDIYIAPVFVGFVDEEQEVTLNHEHSEYKWLSFNEATEYVSLPGNEEVLTFIEKYFVRRQPMHELLIDIR